MLWWLPFGTVPGITAEELSARLRSGEPVELIDVRTEIEFAHGHLAGSRSVPVHTLRSELDRISLDGDAVVVAICKTAHRSIPAVRLLRSRGLDARQLEGGIDRWRELGLPLDKMG